MSFKGNCPRSSLVEALATFKNYGMCVIKRSEYYRSAPVPASTQPWYVNAVVSVDTNMNPVSLLSCLNHVENLFGRCRAGKDKARTLDLDIIDFQGLIRKGCSPPELPHPRAHSRAFVLVPLREIAPNWQHPIMKLRIDTLINMLLPKQEVILIN